MSRKNFPHRVKQRQEEAAVRQDEYDGLDMLSKIARCVRRRGNSKKELAKIKAAHA